MINFFSYSQGKYLLNILIKLADVGIIEESDSDGEVSPKINLTHKRFNNFENNFLVYSSSPLKQ